MLSLYGNIMVTLIVSLFLILQVDSAWSAGNYVEAQRNSDIAKILNIIGIVIGSLAWLSFVILTVVVNVTNVNTISGSTNRFQ